MLGTEPSTSLPDRLSTVGVFIFKLLATCGRGIEVASDCLTPNCFDGVAATSSVLRRGVCCMDEVGVAANSFSLGIVEVEEIAGDNRGACSVCSATGRSTATDFSGA